jgi:hypothetical protein
MSTYLVVTDGGIFETFEVTKPETLFTSKKEGGMLLAKRFLRVKDLSGQERFINIDHAVSFAPINKESTPKNG